VKSLHDKRGEYRAALRRLRRFKARHPALWLMKPCQLDGLRTAALQRAEAYERALERLLEGV